MGLGSGVPIPSVRESCRRKRSQFRIPLVLVSRDVGVDEVRQTYDRIWCDAMRCDAMRCDAMRRDATRRDTYRSPIRSSKREKQTSADVELGTWREEGYRKVGLRVRARSPKRTRRYRWRWDRRRVSARRRPLLSLSLLRIITFISIIVSITITKLLLL